MAKEEVRAVETIVEEITDRIEELEILLTEKDERIAELEGELEERNDTIRALEEELAELQGEDGVHMSIDESDLAAQVRDLKYRDNITEQELATALHLCDKLRVTCTSKLKKRWPTIEAAKRSSERLDKQLVAELDLARTKWIDLKDSAGMSPAAADALRRRYHPPR